MSEVLTVVVTDNTPPFDPTITGPATIKPKVAQTYTFNAVDEFDHDVTFDIDWGDGNGAAGLGPYQSGESLELTHTWARKGSYIIKARQQIALAWRATGRSLRSFAQQNTSSA